LPCETVISLTEGIGVFDRGWNKRPVGIALALHLDGAINLDPADRPLSNLQWAGVLKSCLGYETYQRLVVGRVDPSSVIEFLLLAPQFPRSVRFCLEATASALAAIEGPVAAKRDAKADRMLGRLLSDLRYADLEQILAGNLHAFLNDLLARCNQTSLAIQDHYALPLAT
jgi:uncharacterized alpha-E superfamily protein